ncbi:sulfotransferase [Candidatus Thioglobus sp.]|nr:sulfotransferase [Candidatus Thioglobus sp.]
MLEFVMITGCGHTGTTLLARIMGVHSKIYNPPYETNLFLAYNVLKWNSLLEEHYSDAKKSKEDCMVFLEKTPRHIWHIDYARKAILNAKFILMTRNGRDVIASLYERSGDIQASILRYKDDSLLTIRQLDEQSVLLVRYEDLIINTNSELTKIMSFINLKFEESILNFHESKVNWFNLKDTTKGNGKGDGVEHDKLRNWQVNQPIFATSKLWNERIPREHWGEVDQFFKDCGDEIMQKFGYF